MRFVAVCLSALKCSNSGNFVPITHVHANSCVRIMRVLRLKGREIFYSILFYPITLEGRRGTTDEFATIPFHLDLFSAALVELAKSIPVHSLILSSHIFFCLPLFLFPFTVNRIVRYNRPVKS